MELTKDLCTVVKKILRAACSWAGQLDIQRAGDASRSGCHNDHLVRKIHGLIHIMRYHDGGHAGFLPDPQDLVLHVHAGEGIECDRRSSGRSTLGLPTSALARDARWHMPPESWCGYECSKPLRPTISINSSTRSAFPACRCRGRADRTRCYHKSTATGTACAPGT